MEKLVSLRANIPESYDQGLRQLPGMIGENVRQAIFEHLKRNGIKIKPVIVEQGRRGK